jgi:hypothetical protein
MNFPSSCIHIQERKECSFSTWKVENKQFYFKASAGLVQDFKKKDKIRKRHVTKYTSSEDNATFEEKV